MEEEKALLTPLQSAFNDGVEAAKTIIREHSTEGYCEFDYWRASLINAIARKTNPYAYRADIADERVREARREVWDKVHKAIEFELFSEMSWPKHEMRIAVFEALERARAAEGGEGK